MPRSSTRRPPTTRYHTARTDRVVRNCELTSSRNHDTALPHLCQEQFVVMGNFIEVTHTVTCLTCHHWRTQAGCIANLQAREIAYLILDGIEAVLHFDCEGHGRRLGAETGFEPALSSL